MLTSFDKALVPAIVLLVLGGLGYMGITEGMTVGDAVTLLVSSGLVWLVPNARKA